MGKKMILIVKLLCLFKKLTSIILFFLNFFFDKAVEKNSIRKMCLSKSLIKQRRQVNNNNEI